TSHFSILDVPALMVADPFVPHTAMVVKQQVMRVPVAAQALRIWGCIPVARDGRDLSALRDVIQRIRSGVSVCIAGEGRRNRTGRLGRMNPVLVKLTTMVDVPVFPVVEIGTYESLPPGTRIPLP